MNKIYNSTQNIFNKNNPFDNKSNINDIDIGYDNADIKRFVNRLLSSLEKNINKQKSWKNNRVRPKELISDALKVGEKLKSQEYLNSINKKNKLDIMDDAKIMARTMYVDHFIDTSKSKVQEEFKNFIKSCNQKAITKIEGNLMEIIHNNISCSKIKKENQKLELKLSQINNEVRLLNQKLLERNDEINKLQIKFKPFKRMMPFFEELIQT